MGVLKPMTNPIIITLTMSIDIRGKTSGSSLRIDGQKPKRIVDPFFKNFNSESSTDIDLMV